MTADDPIAWAKQMLAQDPSSAHMRLVDVATGTCTMEMTVAANQCNGFGICHGGILFALADTAFAMACNSHGVKTVAAACDIVFARPGHAGDVVRAVAVERTRFGRSGVYDVTITRDDEVLAEFRGRSRTVG